MDILNYIWTLVQILIGYNLVLPALLYLFWVVVRKKPAKQAIVEEELDYAFIVTAYSFTETLPAVISSITRVNYKKYLIYVVADNCDISDLHFDDERVILLKPPATLASNTRSHAYAVEHFIRPHDVLTIIDSDNLVTDSYLHQLNLSFQQGFSAVQGLRAAKNISGTIASLDAGRDIYYHFYDGKLLFESGSSATLSGSGMAFKTELYKEFLGAHDVTGAGFDKVLQSWLAKKSIRIAFNEEAVIFDEKTSRPDQLVKQRSRWINTWFKYFKLGFGILFKGLTTLNLNQTLFGLILLRPPLFLFLIASFLCFVVNLIAGNTFGAMVWTLSGLVFILTFFTALMSSRTDKRIYKALINVPKFVVYQLISLFKSGNANKISVSTQHFHVNKDQN